MSRWGSPIRPCGHRQHLAFIDSPPPVSGTLLNVSRGLPKFHDGGNIGGIRAWRCIAVFPLLRAAGRVDVVAA